MGPLDFSRPVLVVEAATTSGSVALITPNGAARSIAVAMGAGAADGLFPAVIQLLRDHSLDVSALGAIVCGAGPGSFTSLRIAAALAKGLAHGLGCPLYAVPSLAIAATSLPSDAPAGRYVVHTDALRGERYVLSVTRGATGDVSWEGVTVRRSIDDLRQAADPLVSIGTAPTLLPSRFEVQPDAATVGRAMGSWRDAPVTLASWEPMYGRLAEAQVKWEESHGRPLPDTDPS